MRLIDIDKLVSDYKGKNKSLQNVTWFELTNYEVKAIPIKWLKEHCFEYGCYIFSFNDMIKDWEQENEKNI